MPPVLWSPPWEYTKHPRYGEVASRSAELLEALRKGEIDFQAAVSDTRPYHQRLFEVVTPPDAPYYAGHYRGEDYPLLKNARSLIAGKLASPPGKVRGELGQLKVIIQAGFAALDEVVSASSKHAPEERTYRAIRHACRTSVEFTRIHPYANGNGHMSRWMMWAICGKYGIWPKAWSMHPRPPDPPYSQLIALYRAGNKEPYEKFVLQRYLGM